MDRILSEAFINDSHITMPAGQYLTIYKEMQRLECELAWYKEQHEKNKQTVTETK